MNYCIAKRIVNLHISTLNSHYIPNRKKAAAAAER